MRSERAHTLVLAETMRIKKLSERKDKASAGAEWEIA